MSAANVGVGNCPLGPTRQVLLAKALPNLGRIGHLGLRRASHLQREPMLVLRFEGDPRTGLDDQRRFQRKGQ
jgi:hypothetical protein